MMQTYYAFYDIPEYTLNPIPEDLVREEEFFRSYLNENGLAWHHHHNSTTPSPGSMPIPSRGPPSMHMWSASQVGETHDVFTEHGHW